MNTEDIVVAHFTDTYKPQRNGVVTSICSLNSQLLRRGIHPVIFAPGDEDDVRRDNINQEIPVYTFKGIPFKPYPEYLVAQPHFEAALKVCTALQVNIIHVHTPFSEGMSALYTKQILDLPCVGTFHTLYPEYLHYVAGKYSDSEMVKLPSWKILQAFYKRCDVTIAPSKANAKLLDERGIKNVKVIPNGVDTNKFNPSVDGSSVRKKYCRKKEEVLALYLGRLGFEKDIDSLIGMIDEIRNPALKLLIVGQGPAMKELSELARTMKLLNKQVFFAGFVPDEEVPKYYAACDIFAMPSQTDTQGITVLEALSSGKPVIVFEGACSDHVIHNKNGFVAGTGVNEEFRERLATLAGDAALRKRMQKDARSTALKNSLSVFTERIISVYANLVRRR